MAGSANLLLDIQLLYNQFTKTEKKIADYVIENPNDVLFMSITELADICDVADASVYRFCRTIGARGYQEFKMKLSLSMTVEEPKEELYLGGAEDDRSELIDGILEMHLNALKETRTLLVSEDLDKALCLMEEAEHIYFFGIGDSLLTAKEARNKFLRITSKVSCVDDPHMQAMTVSMVTPRDLIFFISYSGSTKDNVHVAKIAKKSGAKICVITRFVKSPLTSYADVVLLCGSNEKPLQGGSMGVKISQLFIVDILFQEYYRRNKAISKENNKKTSKAVVEKLF